MTWLKAHWRTVAIGFVAFSVGAVAGAGGETDKDAETVAQTVTDVRTETVTETVPGPVRIRTHVKTVAAKPKPAPTTAPSGGGGATKSYSGNGTKNIGTVSVSQDSTVRWTNDGGLFQVFDDEFGFSINSQGSSGDSQLAAGTYRDVTINAIGNWTLRITPR